MKPIDGIDLGKMIDLEEGDHLVERTNEVLRQIRSIAGQRRSWIFMAEQKQRELEKLQENITKATAKLAAIRGGDWGQLKEETIEAAK